MPKTVTVNKRDLEIDFNTGLEVSLNDPLFDLVYERIHTVTQGQEVTPGNITILVTLCMQAVAKVPQLTGQQKKSFVINLVKKVGGDLEGISKTDRRAFQALIDFTLPGMIDALVDASKGKFDFKKVVEGGRKLFSCCRGD
jgi:hypothetical protein